MEQLERPHTLLAGVQISTTSENAASIKAEYVDTL